MAQQEIDFKEQPKISDELINVKQACGLFLDAGICSQTYFFKVYRRQLPFAYYGVKPDGKLTTMRIRRSEVIRYINNVIKNPVMAAE
jgi:hypothetical protein